MRVHLVRHGEVHNPHNIRYGRLPRFALSARGRDEVSAAARLLCNVSEVVSSPLQRALESAEILCQLTGAEAPTVDERLTEASEWREGLPRHFSLRAILSRISGSDPWPHNEGPWVIADRVAKAVLEVASRHPESGAEVALVTHQTPIRLVRLWFERGPGQGKPSSLVRLLPRMVSRHRCGTGSITTLRFEDGRFVSSEYRDSPSTLARDPMA